MDKYSNPSIAFFDFDGTLTSKDTLAEILKFSKGKPAYYFGLLILSPIIISYKLKLMTNERAKEILMAYYFKGMTLQLFDKTCTDFTEMILPKIIREQAMIEIKKHQQNDTKIVVVSSSPYNWLLPWCIKNNIDCIATKLEVKNEKITGKIEGKNCYGQEKVKSILKHYNLSYYSKIYAYGDTPGDRPMLALATDSYYKPFREERFN